MYILTRNRPGNMLEQERLPIGPDELPLLLLTLLLWSDRILLTYARAAFMHLPFIGGTADFIITAVYIALIFMSLPKILGRLRGADVMLGLAVIFTCLANFILFPENTAELKENLPTFLFFTFPLYYIGVTLDYERVYPWLYKLSAITVAAFTVYTLLIGDPMTETQSLYEGNMWASYNFLPHVCVVAMQMLKKPTAANVALSVTGVVMIASLGSRGPLSCVILAIVVYLLLFKNYKHPVLSRFWIIAIAGLIIYGMDTIMLVLRSFAKSVGLSVRVFEAYFEGNFAESEQRNYIAERLYGMIGRKPFVGYGLYADRVALYTYAHNIAIELWHAFGVVFGTGILGGIVSVLARMASVIKKEERYAMLLIPLFVAGFVKLFMSGSFLEEIYLYWLLGISVRVIRNEKKS